MTKISVKILKLVIGKTVIYNNTENVPRSRN